MTRLYLDKCCLGRTLEDPTQDRVRLEAEAITTIMRHVEAGELLWVGSNVLDAENEADSDEDRKAKISAMFALLDSHVTLDYEDMERALELSALGFGQFDAYHVAAAEKASCDVLLTTDDRFLKTAQRNASKLKVKVCNPVDFLMWKMTS
ncbi:MAG: PIN domain-containing protein [Planctomycetota bacterium]